MKVWSQRFGRWLVLAALVLAVAAIAAPTAGARPLGALPCDPGCQFGETQVTAGGPLVGGPSIAQMLQRHKASPVVTATALAELTKFSFDWTDWRDRQPAGFPARRCARRQWPGFTESGREAAPLPDHRATEWSGDGTDRCDARHHGCAERRTRLARNRHRRRHGRAPSCSGRAGHRHEPPPPDDGPLLTH